jgi:CelD/BcsL family acetyltransferase involved in cellulose biosynthesis
MSSKNELAVRVRLPEGTNVKALVRSPDDYSIEVHETLEAAEEDWRRLEREGECLAFQTYFWMKSWQELIGSKLRVSPRVVILRTTDGEAAMIIPLGIRRRRGLLYLSFLAHDISDYQGPLMAKGVGERLAGDFATLWSKVLEQLPPVDLIDFQRMPEVMGDAPNPFAQLPGARQTERAHSASLPSKFEEFLKHPKRKKIHSDVPRKLRRLGEIGEVTFETVEDESKVEKVVKVMACQKGPNYVQAVGFNWFERKPEFKTFYARIAAMRSEQFRGHASTMAVGGVVVSTHVGMIFRNRFYMILPSYAGGEWYRYSPGVLLTEYLIKTAIDSGCTVYDMTVGDEAFKKDWMDTVLHLYALTVPLSLKASMHQRAASAKSKLRGNLKNIDWVRRRIIGIRKRLRRKKLIRAVAAAKAVTTKIDQVL